MTWSRAVSAWFQRVRDRGTTLLAVTLRPPATSVADSHDIATEETSGTPNRAAAIALGPADRHGAVDVPSITAPQVSRRLR